MAGVVVLKTGELQLIEIHVGKACFKFQVIFTSRIILKNVNLG